MAARERDELLGSLPPEWPQDPLPEIRARLARDRRVVVILDDDPTGTQTVHDVPVVTAWDEAEFARDAAFGYSASFLPDWVEEKSGGRLRAADVVLVRLADLRVGGPKGVARRLRTVRSGQVVVSDAVSYRDVEVLVLGLLEAEAEGRGFVYRTAASFYPARGGQGPL